MTTTASRAEPADGRPLVQSHARLDDLRAEPERKPRGLDGRGCPQDGPAEEPRIAARPELVCRQMTDLLRRAERLAGLDRVVRRVELRLARRDDERRRGPVPGVHARLFAPLADAVHAALGRPDDVERPLVTDPVAEDRQVVPERRDEAAVAAARPVPREAFLEHHDIACRLDAFSCHAVQRPRYPPPTTTTSALVSPSSGAVASTGPASSSHQPYRVCRTPSTGPSLTGGILRLRAVAVAQLVEPRVVVPVVAGSSPVRHPVSTVRTTSDRSDEGAAADHALRAIADTPAEAAVRRHEPPRGDELRCEIDDRVVGIARADQVRGIRGRGAVEDHEQLVTLELRPLARASDELLARDVRPLRSTRVLRVDDDQGHGSSMGPPIPSEVPTAP